MQPGLFGVFRASGDDDAAEKARELVATIKKEIEPLLEDASPFFGGNERVTMAEALTGSFVIRLYAYARADLLPRFLIDEMDGLKNFSKWAKSVMAAESVTYVWDEEKNIEGIKKRMEKVRKTS